MMNKLVNILVVKWVIEQFNDNPWTTFSNCRFDLEIKILIIKFSVYFPYELLYVFYGGIVIER